jgi:hypothetical protein
MEPTPRLEATTPINATATTPAGPGVNETAAITDPLPAVGFDPFSLVLRIFGGSSDGLSSNAVLDFLGALWNVYVVLAIIFSLGLLVLYAYASTLRWYYYGKADDDLREAEALYDAQFKGVTKNSRLDDIQQHVMSENPNDWKLAIIEADIILDGILKERGYAGNTLGERLRSVSPNQLASLQDAWSAHKTRNMIAHEGPDFVLTKRMAEDAIKQYMRVFNEFGIT